MIKQINLNTLLIIVATVLVLVFQQCQNNKIQSKFTGQQRMLMSELSAFERESLENTKTFQGEVLTQKELLQAVKGELSTLDKRLSSNGRKLNQLSSSTSFLTSKVEDIEIPSTLVLPKDTTEESSVLESPIYEIPNDEDIYENYLHLPIGSQWTFEDNLLKGSTTLLASGEGSTKYNIKPIQFDVDIFRKWRLFGPDKYTADITSSAMPINAASVNIRKIPRPRLVLSIGGGVGATWDGNKVIYGPSINAQVGIPLITLISK